MDLEMQGMDGFTATSHIRDIELREPRRSRAWIVAYTASDVSDEASLHGAGMDDILRKPCDVKVVALCMERRHTSLQAPESHG